MEVAGIQDRFARKLMGIKGVKGFLLARDDGQVLAQRMIPDNPENVSAMMVLSGLNSRRIKGMMGLSSYSYMMLKRDGNQHIFIFPIRNYFLCVYQQEGDFDPRLIEKLELFIRKIKQAGKKTGARNKLPA